MCLRRDHALYDPTLQAAYNATFVSSYSADQPLYFGIGNKFYESFQTFPDTQYIYGFNFAYNTTTNRELLLESVPLVCNALRGGKFAYYELGNEPDLYTAFPSYPTYVHRPIATWTEQEFVIEWLNGTRAIREALAKACPEQATDAAYKYIAPSFAEKPSGTLDPVQVFYDGLDSDHTVGQISTHG